MRLLFKWTALLEALSWFGLLGTMYLKYAQDMPDPNKVVGMAHGVLSVAYFMLAFAVVDELKWSKRDLSVALVAALIPGATIYVERVMMREESSEERA